MSLFTKGKVLVTGGAGLIGSALIWALNQRGLTNIIVTDFLGEDDKFRNLVPLQFIDYLEGDSLLQSLDKQPSLMSEFNTIFHLGACSATTERNARYLLENNYEYTKRLAKAALRLDTRFVYASSAATYGDGRQGMDDQENNLHKLQPLNMYGYSKHLFDLYAQKQGFINKIVGLKYFNIFGPNEDHKGEMRSVVNKAFRQVHNEGKIRLFKSYRDDYADGEQQRDFLYIKDAVAMTLHLAETPQAHGLYNLGSGEAKTWNTLAKTIFAAMNRPTNIEYIDMPEHLQANYQYYTCANISKLRATGYRKNITPLDKAVADYIQQYLSPGKHLGQEASI